MQPIEATIRLERDDCITTNTVMEHLHDAKVDRLRIGKESSLHRVVSENVLDTITELRRVSISVKQASHDTLWVETKSCKACEFLSRHDIPVMSSRSVDRTHVEFRVLVQSEKSLHSLMKSMTDSGLKPLLVSKEKTDAVDMTKREKEVLLFAFNHGYFDAKRDASLTELAKNLNVAPSTLSEVLRRALKKVVSDYLKKS